MENICGQTVENSINTMTMFTVLPSRKAIARVYSGHLNDCPPVPGGRKLVGQAANLTFQSTKDCYRPNVHPTPFVSLFSHKANSFYRPQKAEST